MDFAFLIHSRDWTDVQRKFKIAKYLPKSWVEFWCLHWPPVVVSKITGLKSQIDGREIKGWLIGVPMTAKQMMENRDLAKKRIIQAIKKAEKLGVGIVGLGALTSSVTNGGLEIVDKVGVNITTGNALTVSVSFVQIRGIIKKNKIDKIAVVGATGSIGAGITKLLVREYLDRSFLLFARTKEHLDDLGKEIEQLSPKTKIEKFFNNLENLKEADLIIVATASPDVFIKSGFLKNGAIIYDITQPRNISVAELQKRPDVKIYDGGLVFVPQLEKKLPLGLPGNTIFACLGEAMLLALENIDNSYLGGVSLQAANNISKIAEKYGFRPVKIF